MEMRRPRNRWEWGSKALAAVLSLLVLSHPFPALAVVEFNERLPLIDDFDSCTGERVSITGTQHIIGRFTEDGAGRLHFGFTRNSHGTGTGQVSGASYVLIDAVSRSSFEVTPGEVTTFTELSQVRLLRRGEAVPDDDTQILLLTHFTVTPDGTVTASVEVQRVECR